MSLQDFLTLINSTQHLTANGRTYTSELGRKFARIVRQERCNRTVWCFVNLATGDIHKAEGWKKPHPKPRGNLATFDPAKADWTGS